MMLFSLHNRNQLHKELPGEGFKGSIWQHAINTFAGFSAVRQNVAVDGMNLILRCSCLHEVSVVILML